MQKPLFILSFVFLIGCWSNQSPALALKVDFSPIPEKVFIQALQSTRALEPTERCIQFAIQIMQKKREYKAIYKLIDRNTANIEQEAKSLIKMLARRFLGVNWAEMKPGVTKALKNLFARCGPLLDKFGDSAELEPIEPAEISGRPISGAIKSVSSN